MKLKLNTILAIFIAITTISSGCKSDSQPKDTDTTLDIRLREDPAKLNPIIQNTSVARLVHQYIFLPLCDHHPETKQLYPILLQEMPKLLADPDRVSYEMSIREEATWDNGRSIDANDFLFTMKLIMVPSINASRFRGALEDVLDIEVDPVDPKTFKIYLAQENKELLENAITNTIFPRDIYDPDNLLSDFSYSSIRKAWKEGLPISETPEFLQYVKDMNEFKYSRDVVNNNGPYQLDNWETDRAITLTAKQDYWGNKFPDIPFLQQGPEKMIFYIIPDETTAITQIKNGNLDVINSITSKRFSDLKNDPNYKDNFQFFTPSLSRYYFLGINNSHPILKDREVRKALSLLLDVDKIIEKIEYGMGERLTSVAHPSRSYYNNDLVELKYNPEEAKTLLSSAGWEDSDSDGDLDKNMDGQLTDLEFDIFVSEQELGQTIALMLQENARNIGIKVNIITKSFRSIMSENVRKRDYGMAALLANQTLNDDDFYGRWHSDNDDPRKNNHISYRDEKVDNLIEQIENAKDIEEKEKLYKEIQAEIYQDHPVIFLYAPLEKIVVSNRWKGSATIKRPGYMANTFVPNNL